MRRINKNSLILLSSISFVVVNSMYLLLTVPIFADGAIYAKTILDTINWGFVSNDISYLPNFFLIGAVLTLFTKNVEITLAILNILPILLLIILMYSVLSKQFNKQVGLYTAVFLSFTPMFLWVISHRLIDPLTYFFPILFIWAYLRFIRSFNSKEGILIAIFLLTMIGLKSTLLPFIIGIFLHMAYSLLKNTKKQYIKIIKGVGIAGFFTIFLFLPYLQYCYPIYASYICPHEKLEEQYIFSILPEQKLEQIIQIQNQFLIKQGTLLYLPDYLKEGEITGALQFFSLLPVYEKARGHWFSPFAGSVWSIFLVIFLFGMIYWIKGGFFKKDYSKFLIISSIGIIPFMRYFAIMRYLFYINIMTSVFFGFGFYYITKKIKTLKFAGAVMTAIVVVSLSLLIAGEVEDILPYKNSYGHNRVPEGGVSELVEVKKDIPAIVGATIFTLASEPAYYLNGETMWDWRLFFVNNEEDIIAYFEHYNITYLIIPKYSLCKKVWVGDRQVTNDLENFANPFAVPLDSTFYHMLNDGTFQKIKEYKAFIVHKVQINDS